MFTGLVQAKGSLRSRSDRRITIDAPDAWQGDPWVMGESVAVNGVCLTVVDFADGLVFDLSEETLDRTTLGGLALGGAVNLERALRMGDRLGGHLVQGHVDGTGACLSITPQDGGWLFRFRIDPSDDLLLIDKGSICLDGISLTVVAPNGPEFEVAVIPHTFESTNLGQMKPGDAVNYELDIVAKHIARLTAGYRGQAS
jgi:riboflavin synthase